MKLNIARPRGCCLCLSVFAFMLGTVGMLTGCGRTAELLPADEAPDQNEESASNEGAEEGPAETGKITMTAEDHSPLMTFEEANGFELYQHYCMVCHGEIGEGDGFNAFNLDPKPRSLVDQPMQESVTDEELTRSITVGGAGRNKSPLMPRWGHTFNTRQIRYVIAYIRLLQRQAQSVEANSELRRQAPGAPPQHSQLGGHNSRGV